MFHSSHHSGSENGQRERESNTSVALAGVDRPGEWKDEKTKGGGEQELTTMEGRAMATKTEECLSTDLTLQPSISTSHHHIPAGQPNSVSMTPAPLAQAIIRCTTEPPIPVETG